MLVGSSAERRLRRERCASASGSLRRAAGGGSAASGLASPPPRLPEKVDLALFVDVYHHIEQRERYFRRLAASLKPGARVAVIDFRLDSPEGPPKSARIEPERVKAELAAAGYVLTAEHGFLPYQYFLEFSPAR